MGGAISAAGANLTDDQKVEVFEKMLPENKASREKKLKLFNDEAFENFADMSGYTDAVLQGMNEQFNRITGEMGVKSIEEEAIASGSSQVFRDRKGKSEKVVVGNPVKSNHDPHWRYQPGDTIKHYRGETAFTVQRQLGAGAFGEVHVVVDEGLNCDPIKNSYLEPFPKRDLAMKCTKFDSMTRESRIALFRPLCEESLLMFRIKAHPNLLVLRHVYVSGEEFLVFMDLIGGSMELEDALHKGVLWDSIDGGRASWQSPPGAKITSLMALLWHQLLSALDCLHGLQIIHCDVKPENAMVNPKTLHLHLFDMGLAREGTNNAKGELMVLCDGCTPAFAGPEVGDLFNKMSNMTLPEERTQLKHNFPIDVASSDLWASALTILSVAFPAGDRAWTKGADGPGVLNALRCVEKAKASTGKSNVRDWTHEDTMQVVKNHLPLNGKHKEKIVSIFEKISVDGMLLEKLTCKKDLASIKGLSLGARTNFWVAWRPYKALPFDDQLLQVMERSMSSANKDRYRTAKEAMTAVSPIMGNLAASVPSSASTPPEHFNRRMEMITNVGNALLNHGYFTSAKDTLRDALVLQGENVQIPTVKGLTVALALIPVDSSPDGCSEQCDLGLDEAVATYAKVSATASGRASSAFVRAVAVLCALCIGNLDNATALCGTTTSAKDKVFGPLILGLEESISKSLLMQAQTILCLFYLVSSSNNFPNVMVVHMLPAILDKFGDNGHIVTIISWYSRNLAGGNAERFYNTEMKKAMLDNQLFEKLVEKLRTHHMDDSLVCAVVLNNFFNWFIIPGSETYERASSYGVANLVAECDKRHSSSSPIMAAYAGRMKTRF